MSNDTPGPQRSVSPDTVAKFTLSQVATILGSIFIGTAAAFAMYYGFAQKIDKLFDKFDQMEKQQAAQEKAAEERNAELAKKIEESGGKSIFRINYLFRILRLDNPFEGIYNEPTAATPTLPTRGAIP